MKTYCNHIYGDHGTSYCNNTIVYNCVGETSTEQDVDDGHYDDDDDDFDHTEAQIDLKEMEKTSTQVVYLNNYHILCTLNK